MHGILANDNKRQVSESICLTSRGSAVRPRQLPLRTGKGFIEKWNPFLFYGLNICLWACFNKSKVSYDIIIYNIIPNYQLYKLRIDLELNQQVLRHLSTTYMPKLAKLISNNFLLVLHIASNRCNGTKELQWRRQARDHQGV